MKVKSSPTAIEYCENKGMSMSEFHEKFDKDLNNMAIAIKQKLFVKREAIEKNMIDTAELRKAGKAVFLATEEPVAKDLSDKLLAAANEIDELKDFAIWMTGCGYDFCQHEYFCQKRDELLK